jgi:FAD:protein FMN transferase
MTARYISRKLTTRSVLILVCIMTACTREPVKETFFAMGAVPVKIIATGISADHMKSAVRQAQDDIEAWEKQLSFYRADSMVNEIRQSPGIAVRVPAETWETLSLAGKAYELSGGTFDITVGPLTALWKTAEKNQMVPDQSNIDSVTAGIGFNRLKLDPAAKTVTYLSAPDSAGNISDIQIDIGGIAKGLFAEWISRDIHSRLPDRERKRAEKLIINVGGDMYCRSFAEQAACVIGIQDPFGDGVWGSLTVTQGAVVTSGTYERFFDIQGKKYCHIIDPRTGYPIKTDLVSVTILDPSGAMADALATTVFVLGEENGWNLIMSRPESEMVLIRKDGGWRATPGVQESLTKY